MFELKRISFDDGENVVGFDVDDAWYPLMKELPKFATIDVVSIAFEVANLIDAGCITPDNPGARELVDSIQEIIRQNSN